MLSIRATKLSAVTGPMLGTVVKRLAQSAWQSAYHVR